MDNTDERLNGLSAKLETLLRKHEIFEAEIRALRSEIMQLRSPGAEVNPEPSPRKQEVITDSIFPPRLIRPVFPPPPKKSLPSFSTHFRKENLGKSSFEKFIGENLISKIGILILVIGVAIGAKLAIDQDLVSPLTRIILGYLSGICLLGLAIKLKAKYEGFSAVLLSGAIAILYFITFAAYHYYALIPQLPAFAMMVVFTSFTVVAAVKYNKQVIAHVGLVGAYAIPFLLSNNSGNVTILFSYISLINVGILVLSFVKYWKSLFYASFVITWVIFLGWQIDAAAHPDFLTTSLTFASINFLTFYLTNLTYKVSKRENFEIGDVIVLLVNSFIFYGLGYWSLSMSLNHSDLLGLFTLLNAIVHLVVSVVIFKRNLADQKLFYFLLALVITFITIAVPVQLQGSWITIFWAIEAGILYYFGRKKDISIFEKLTLALVYLAFFSFLQDGFLSSRFYLSNEYIRIRPFLNVGFLSACLFMGSFSWMYLIGKRTTTTASTMNSLLSSSISVFLIIVTYYAFHRELTLAFDNLIDASGTRVSSHPSDVYTVHNPNYVKYGTVASYCYTMFFAALLTLINLKKIESKSLAVANVAINLVVIIAFLTHGLFVLSELRTAYLAQDNQYFIAGKMNLGLRYIAYLFFAFLISLCYKLSKSTLFKVNLKTGFDYLLYLAILWLLSSELLHLLALNGWRTGYKLGLSILWGTYALSLIGIGIWKGKKYLRIGAIILFAITLMKLFLYDLTSLNTISKTIVFVSLGILLLIISFLYNKYKHLIDDNTETKS